jgi:hypothetical protein
LIDEPQEQRSEAVGFTVWIFDAVTTEPADEEENRHFASGVLGTGKEGTQFVPARVADPVVENLSILKMFPWLRLLGANGTRKKHDANENSRNPG